MEECGRDLVSSGHIFSPNEREAVSLVGPGPPLELIERLSELGAEVVVLRRGPLGCIVHRQVLFSNIIVVGVP
jgi:sugar/nucleoside kinase (ribokinase family)